jgi:adenylate cyclase
MVHGGREIKHTGDGIMAAFNSVWRALECGITIQRAVAARSEDDDPLRVRIGLSAGEPLAENDDLFGTVVQLAARICAHAAGGEILVPDPVRQLAAGKGFVFADVDEVTLRGFAEPVRLCRVQWRGAGDARADLPAVP